MKAAQSQPQGLADKTSQQTQEAENTIPWNSCTLHFLRGALCNEPQGAETAPEPDFFTPGSHSLPSPCCAAPTHHHSPKNPHLQCPGAGAIPFSMHRTPQ